MGQRRPREQRQAGLGLGFPPRDFVPRFPMAGFQRPRPLGGEREGAKETHGGEAHAGARRV